jgi:ATP-dependent phosphofructokinase / diphosphate-dependent phosphofructokinase
MSKRIGVVTGGGDCPGLNAVIRAVAKAAAKRGWECIGVLGGYEGLLEPRRTIPLDYQILSGLLPRAERFSARRTAGGFRPKLVMVKLEHCRRNC